MENSLENKLLAIEFYNWCLGNGFNDPKAKTLKYWLSLKEENFSSRTNAVWNIVNHIHFDYCRGDFRIYKIEKSNGTVQVFYK